MRPSLTYDLARAAARDSDMAGLAQAIWTAIGRSVPFVFACLATIDPATGLISRAYNSHPLPMGDEEWSAAEYGRPDLNQFSEIALRDEPIGVLSIDTHGHPEKCLRFREFLAPQLGFTDELRVAFRTQGLVWGALALHRGPGEPPFTAAEARAVVAVHGQIAELLRTAVFDGERGAPEVTAGPAVVIVDAADRVVNVTPAAEARIVDLGGWDGDSLPSTVLAATAAARHTPDLAATRAVGDSGAWLVVRASEFASGTGGVVVTMDVASPAEIGALALAARGLSPREQEVAALVLQGAATKAIAESLFLSPHTVQDHLKSIFAKLGVNSRREMVRLLVIG